MDHSPVLLRECIEALNINPDGVYIDGTLGRGGHTLEIAKKLQTGRIIAIDRDADAIKETSESLYEYKDRIFYVHGNFADTAEIMDAEGIGSADGMIFDLGLSSPQLDDENRGFSYMHDAPLDMRMDREDTLSAFEAVNSWSEDRLRQIFYEYGEEKYSRAIAQAIIRKRAKDPLKTTFELRDAIISAMPAAARREPQHPAKRCFQALRIAVNDELGSIDNMLESAPKRLKTGGRICVISFHSLEDRLVKNSFSAYAKGCVCPRDFPVCLCGFEPVLKILTKKPLLPSKAEVDSNPRARSAKLRVAERI